MTWTFMTGRIVRDCELYQMCGTHALYLKDQLALIAILT